MDRLLWETNVGSHMWGMAHANSDYDIFQAYVVPTKSILRGTAKCKSSVKAEGLNDYAIHEIGHIINYRLKGNVNFMWGIHSPIIIKDSRELTKLRRLSQENLSKNIYHSINGLAKKNNEKYILTKETPPHIREKKGRIIARTINFGIKVLQDEKIEFEAFTRELSIGMIELMLDNLKTAYEHSELPETPDEEPFREYLENVRVMDYDTE